MEHDPDFDENGDATALPDFPAFTKEDPFDNRYSVTMKNATYPGMSLPNKLQGELRSMSTRDSTIVDGFVLPYHHQTGSKASLEEFAKQLVDNNLVRKNLLPMSQDSQRTSPQKSALRHEQQIPVKMTKGYSNLSSYTGNGSQALFNADEFYNTKEEFNDSGTTKSSHDFSVEYENDLTMALNSTLPNISPVKPEESPSHPDPTVDNQSVSTRADRSLPVIEVSPFEDHTVISERSPAKSSHPTEKLDGDFDFSNETMDFTAKKSSSTPETSFGSQKLSKSPRMSAFNMLQNVSDDENEDVPLENQLTEEQAEELARMKSVYKVYFDRTNSMKEAEAPGARSFKHDASVPLPVIDVDNLKINSELTGDTSYDRRKTTTSSIYEENPIFSEDQQFATPEQQFATPEQQYQYYQEHYPHLAQQYPEPPPEMLRELPPLKYLPHASDFRNSTIETFTEYQPRAKMVSPSMKHKFNPLETEQSPYMESQTSFSAPGTPDMGDLPPTLRKTSAGSRPSPTQLSRSSVVMLNPVTEIMSLRTFKPAGSLPSGAPRPGNHAYLNDEMASSGDDLIPGNRKSAVRRMMNTNF